MARRHELSHYNITRFKKKVKSIDRSLLNYFKRVSKALKIKLVIKKETADIVGSASAFPPKSMVYIEYNPGLTPPELMLSWFCHEVAHILNFRDRKFFAYHNLSRNPDNLSNEQIRLIIKTAIRAEKYTDLRGAGLLKEMFPENKFYGFYHRKDVQEQFRKTFIDYYKKLLTWRLA